jgi:DNA-directed RNA polymerase subunit RPC12/RpoP
MLGREDWYYDQTMGKKVIQCAHCPYRTLFMGNLRTHHNYKHSTNPVTFSCPFCEYFAKRKGDLKAHIVSRHQQNLFFKP